VVVNGELTRSIQRCRTYTLVLIWLKDYNSENIIIFH